jgi:hypothetical protein
MLLAAAVAVARREFNCWVSVSSKGWPSTGFSPARSIGEGSPAAVD